VQLDQLPLLVGQLAVGEQDRVGQDELADVVQQRGGVDQVLLALVEPEHRARPRASSGRPRPNGGRHRVAHRQRLQHRREQPDLQRRELLGAALELDPALVRLHARADQVLEDEQHDGEQPDAPTPMRL
jgi:hypothetical protein